jgi:hypothetical protein
VSRVDVPSVDALDGPSLGWPRFSVTYFGRRRDPRATGTPARPR